MTTAVREVEQGTDQAIECHLERLNASYDLHLLFWREGDSVNAWHEQRRRDAELQWFVANHILLGYDDKKFVLWKEKGRG